MKHSLLQIDSLQDGRVISLAHTTEDGFVREGWRTSTLDLHWLVYAFFKAKDNQQHPSVRVALPGAWHNAKVIDGREGKFPSKNR